MSYYKRRYSAKITHTKLKKAKQVWMYYRSGTGVRCCICVQQTLCCHSLGALGALFCVKWRHGRHLEIMTSNQKSDAENQHVFSWGSILPNFILIRFETTKPCGMFWRGRSNNKTKKQQDEWQDEISSWSKKTYKFHLQAVKQNVTWNRMSVRWKSVLCTII